MIDDKLLAALNMEAKPEEEVMLLMQEINMFVNKLEATNPEDLLNWALQEITVNRLVRRHGTVDTIKQLTQSIVGVCELGPLIEAEQAGGVH